MSKNLVKSAFWITISEIIFNISGFIIHSVVGRILGPAEYGRYALVITLTTMVIILIGNGIPTAMAKYISEIFQDNATLVKTIKKQAILIQSILVSFITIAFFFSAPLLAKILGDNSLTNLFRLSTLIIPAFAAASFYFSYYTGLHKFNIQATIKTARSIFRLFFIIILAYFFKIKGAIIGYILAPAIIFLLGFLIDKFKVSPELNQQSKSEIQTATFKWQKLVNYAWQIIIFFLAYEFLISIDLYMVKGILGSDFLTGIYNAALTIGRIPYYIFYALTVILLPVISNTTSQNKKQATTNIINHSLRLMITLLVPAVILMSVFAKPIITLFYSTAYASASAAMSILVWGVGFLTIYYIFCFVMSGAGKVKKPMVISLFGLSINIVLNYLFIHQYGIIGSAIATSITSVIITLIMLYYVWLEFGVSIQIKSISKIFIAGGITYWLALFFSQGQFIFILWLMLLFAFYILLLYLLREIKKEDFIFLKNSILKKN